jgi:hypothetical protein
VVVLALLLGGCPGPDTRPEEEAVLPPESLARGTAAVLAAQGDAPLALGAIVRVTYETAVILGAVPDDTPGPFRVQLSGDAPVGARLLGRAGGIVVLAVARSGRDLRPFEVAPEGPLPLEQGSLVLPRPGAPIPVALSTEPPPGRTKGFGLAWIAQLPDTGEDLSTEARARRVQGSLVLDSHGRLLALVGPPDGDRPRSVLASFAVASIQALILQPPGADLVRPDDVFLVYSVRVEALSGLPDCSYGDEGGPMLVLELHVAGEAVGRIEVTSGHDLEETLVVTHGVGPVGVELLALDRNLAQGETRVELAKPAVFFALAPRLDLALELRPEQVARYKGPRVRTGAATRARLTFEPVDPDRDGGGRRTPSGAGAVSPGRPAESNVDLARGQATEFFTISEAARDEVVAFLFRRRLGNALDLRFFKPGYEGDQVALLAPAGGPHVAAAPFALLRGRSIARVRQEAGVDAAPFELLVASRSDPSEVVGPLFRLVNREAGREGTAFMDSDAFVDDVAAALAKADLPHDALCRAVLDELGGRTAPVTRRLAFGLLERHLVPSRAILEEVYGGAGPGAGDAGLILAELDPRDARLRPIVRRACSDDDSYMRARAAHVAARSGDPGFADEVADALAGDTAPIVERAVMAARVAAAQMRAATVGK